MLRYLRLAPAALFVLAVGSSSSAFGQAGAPGDAPSELPPPSPVPPPEALPPPPAPKGTPPLKVDAPNGSSIKFGLLLQPQFQTLSSATLDGYTSNLYLRRARLLFGGNLFGVVDYFVDTEFANLFISNTTSMTDAMMNTTYATSKVTPGMNIQDAFATAKLMGDMVKVDAGYMLPPLAHNAVQGAGTLLGWDYFRFSFQHGNVFGTTASPVGRDLGVQLRGLIVNNKVEYRLGLFQGLRKNQTATEVAGKNMFRVAGRLQLNIFDPETGFFYGGTYLGTKKVLSVGLSADLQGDYKYFAGDIFADLPVGPGVVTAQLNVAHWNGDGFVVLPKQTAIMGEAGYLISDVHLTPIVRVEKLMGTAGVLANETRISGGVAFWPYGHNSNLKLFFTSVDTTGTARKVNQVNLQWQVYYF